MCISGTVCMVKNLPSTLNDTTTLNEKKLVRIRTPNNCYINFMFTSSHFWKLLQKQFLWTLAQLDCVDLSHVGTLFQREILASFPVRQCWNIPIDNFLKAGCGSQLEIILAKWFILRLQEYVRQQGQSWFKTNYLEPFNFLFRMCIYAHFADLGLVHNWEKKSSSSYVI